MPVPLHFFIPIASILITSLSLRFLPAAVCVPRSNISSEHQNYHEFSSNGIETLIPEGPWYSWTAGQVQEWVRNTISADPETTQTLRKHNIQGIDLPLLSVSDYQSIGLQLGVACHLKRAIAKLRLKDKFVTTDQSTSLGWLEQLDQQHQLNPTDSTRTLDPNDELIIDEYGVPVSTDAVNAIFQERYGYSFDLPQLASHRRLAESGFRQKSVCDIDKPPSSIQQSRTLLTDTPLVQNGLPIPNEYSGEPPSMSLPPHIRSIYERKPHLVTQLLAQKQRNYNEEQRALLSDDKQQAGDAPEADHGGIYHSIQ